MLAVVFLPGARPRETLSGYAARRNHKRMAACIDRVMFWHHEHCDQVAIEERAARRALNYRAR